MNHKLPKILIVTIIASSISLVLLFISILTAVFNVKRVEKSINNIGEVTYTIDSENKIDEAINLYQKLDVNINLNKNVSNIQLLEDGKYEYVRLAIKKALVLNERKIADSIDVSLIKDAVNEANLKLKKYYKESEFESIKGYLEFKFLLDEYGTEEEKETPSNAQPEKTEEPEIC